MIWRLVLAGARSAWVQSVPFGVFAERDLIHMKKVLALLCLAASLVYPQAAGRIDGTVVDPTGAAVPGAEAAVTNIATGQLLKATTNERGEWALPAMAAGEYKVLVSKPGFKSGSVPSVTVSAGVPA